MAEVRRAKGVATRQEAVRQADTPKAYVLSEHRFRAMNTDVAAWLWAEPGPAAVWLPEVESFFAEVEAELSRFRPDSGLSRLNAAAGRGPQTVTPMLATVLQIALDERERTNGIFDPAILPSLKAAGYDRSFELLGALVGTREGGVSPKGSQGAGQASQGLSERSVAPAAIALERLHASVELPEGAQIDLGGIAKGWTVDRAAELLGAWGAALVDAGGDIRASAAPGGEPWPVAVEDPFSPEEDLAVAHLKNGAIATSSVLKRNWMTNGRTMHHLIDPRTGRPSESDLVSVTVLAPTTVRAEITAKVALILGRADGRAFIAEAGLEGLLVDRDGRVETVGREESWQLSKRTQRTI